MTSYRLLNHIALICSWILCIHIVGLLSTLTCFSGQGTIVNKLSNRPIISTEELVEIELQTIRENASIFHSGSENQWISLDLLNGWPILSVQLPVLGEPKTSMVLTPDGNARTDQNPTTRRLVEVNLRVPQSLRGPSRLDDNQWHEIRLHRTGNALKLLVDDELLVYRRLGDKRQTTTSLLRTHTITLGGSVNAVGLGYDIRPLTYLENFSGRMLKALFIADGLTMDILKYTKTEKHGFRTVSVGSDINKAVLFDEGCRHSYWSAHERLDSQDLNSIAFHRTDPQKAYLKIHLPSSEAQRELRANRADEWVAISLNCTTTETGSGLLFLLESPAYSLNQQISKELDQNNGNSLRHRMRSLGAELLNGTVNIIIQTDLHSFAQRMGTVDWIHHSFLLEVEYQILQYTDNPTKRNELPLVRMRMNPFEKWMYIGPGRENSSNLELLSQETAQSYLEDNKVSVRVAPRETSVMWFGRELWLGGLNFSQREPDLMRYTKLTSVTGLQQNFVGCFHRVTFNTITLDLASYVDAHQKFPGSYLYKNEDEYTGLELVHKGCSRSAREQATCFGSSSGRSSGTARRSVICQNNGRCVERWNQPVCDCFTTLHTGSRCEKATNIVTFNGRQMVRIRRPSCATSRMENVQFAFRTDQTDVIIMSAGPVISNLPGYSYSNTVNSSIKDLIRKTHNMSTRLEIRLVSGQLQITYFVHAIELMFQLPSTVADDKWHFFKLRRIDYSLVTELDGIYSKRNIFLKQTGICMREILVGIQEIRTPTTKVIAGFLGYIAHFRFNGISLDSERSSTDQTDHTNQNTDQLNWIVEATAERQLSTDSALTTPVSESRTSLYAYPVSIQEDPCSVGLFTQLRTVELPIRISLRTWLADGSLLLIKDKIGLSYLHLGLKEGKVKLLLKQADGRSEMGTVDTRINDGSWHFVTIARVAESSDQLTVRIYHSLYKRESQARIPLLDLVKFWGLDFDGQLFVGGLPNTLAWKSTGMPSKSFQGCLAGFSMANQPPLDMLREFQVPTASSDTVCTKPPTADCLNFRSTSHRCTYAQGIDANAYDLPDLTNHNSPICKNGGECFELWDNVRCECTKTTFRGPYCDQVGETLVFGSSTPNKTAPVEAIGDSSLQRTTSSEELIGFVKIRRLLTKSCYLHDEFGMGIQIPGNLDSSHQPSDKDGSMTILLVEHPVEQATKFHLYLWRGYLHMTYGPEEAATQISVPKVRLDDGFYHRIRGWIFDNYFRLELDGKTHLYRVKHIDVASEENIWIGHAPTVNRSTYFRGYMTGAYYNGLQFYAAATGMATESVMKVTVYPTVDSTTSFVPRLSPGSPFAIRPLFSKQPPQKSAPSRVFQGQLSYLKMSTRPTEALGSIPAAQSFTSNASIIQTGPFEINNIKKHRSPSDFATSRAVLYHQLNIWLILSLVLVGSTLMFSLVFLVYRCRSSHSAGTHVNAKQVSHQPVSLSVASNQAKVEGATELDDSNVFPGDPVTLQSYHFAYNTLGSQNRATLKSASPTQCTFKRYPCTTTQYFSFPGPAAEPADTPV